MAGMGLRDGEALAVNVNNMVAKDVYRVHQQVHDRTGQSSRLITGKSQFF
jgi:hypothetical protein